MTPPRWLDWPEAPLKGDAADFAALVADDAALAALIAAAPPFTGAEGGSDAPGAAAEPWRLPTPLDAYDVPPFPAWALPAWQRDYVRAMAVETQTPIDLAGLLSLAVLATAAARRVVVLVRPGWREPLVLYILAILPPGTRKSAVFDATTAPVLEYEQELVDLLAPLIAERQQAYRLAEARLKAAESAAVKAKPDEADFLEAEARARREELAEIVVPASPQLIGDDVTPEALSRLLHENRERFAVFSAEGDLFEIMAGRYSDGSPNFAVYLKGHSEDMLKVNRVGRPPDYVRRAALTLAITAQPSVLAGLARTGAFRGRGLLARLVYAVPANLVGSRDSNAPSMPEAVRAAYRCAVRALLTRIDPAEAVMEAPTTVPDAKELVLDAGAQARLVDFSAALKPRLGPSGDLHHVADWAGKYAGLVVRFAGLLHLADRWADPEPWHAPVSAETVERATALAEYALGHALAAFGAMGADPATAGARQVWQWIADRGLSTVPRADLYQALRGRFPKSADLDAPLVLLVEYGYLRPLAPTVDRYAEGRRGPQGRTPSASYLVNPLALAVAAENPGNAEKASQGADSADSQHFRDFQRPGTPADGLGQGRRRVAV